jgi:hypothetical protein
VANSAFRITQEDTEKVNREAKTQRWGMSALVRALGTGWRDEGKGKEQEVEDVKETTISVSFD